MASSYNGRNLPPIDETITLLKQSIRSITSTLKNQENECDELIRSLTEDINDISGQITKLEEEPFTYDRDAMILKLKDLHAQVYNFRSNAMVVKDRVSAASVEVWNEM